MKTKSIFITLLMVAVAAVSAVSKDDPRNLGLAVVAVKGSEVFKVIYKSESTSRIKLNVYNSSSEIVFSETINGVDGFIRPLNFSGLQFGEYTIELVDAMGKKSERISYQPVKSESTIHISKMKDDDSQYLLSVENNASKAISVKIFDANSNLLYNASQPVSRNYAQLFRLKDVQGAVTFEVSDSAGKTKVISF